MSDRRWSVTEYRGPQGLAALERDWRRLWAEMPDPGLCHSYEAFLAYVEHLCPASDRLTCYALSDGERVRAILPIEERPDLSLVERGLGVRLRVWGMPWCEDWSITDAIGPEDDARRALLPAVIQHLRWQPGRPAVLVLGRTRETSAMWDGLARVSPLTRYEFADGGEFVMPTDMSAEAFAARLSRGARSALRKGWQKFQALNGSAYVRAVSPDDLSAEFERFLEVEASGWKGRHGSAVRQRPSAEAFYRALLTRLVLDGHCEIHSLQAEGRCIASKLCAYTRSECSTLKSGYDEDYARVSPGRLITNKTYEQACEDPLIDRVSAVSDAPWLQLWLPSANGMRRAYVSLRPMSGALALLALRLRYGPVRAVVRRMKARKRARDDRTQVRRGRDAG